MKEIRIHKPLEGTIPILLDGRADLKQIVTFLFTQPEARKQFDNVVEGIHNLVWDGKEVYSVHYDLSTNEILLVISDDNYVMCEKCHGSCTKYSVISKRSGKRICGRCERRELELECLEEGV